MVLNVLNMLQVEIQLDGESDEILANVQEPVQHAIENGSWWSLYS